MADVQPSVTGRPNDTPIREPMVANSTLAERRRARLEAEAPAVVEENPDDPEAKAVEPAEVENKAVGSAAKKGRRRASS